MQGSGLSEVHGCKTLTKISGRMLIVGSGRLRCKVNRECGLSCGVPTRLNCAYIGAALCMQYTLGRRVMCDISETSTATYR